MDHRHSLATSDTTYHSFNDIELFEPASPPRRKKSTSSKASASSSSASSSRRKQESSSSATTTTTVHRHRRSARSADEDDRPPTAYQMKRQDSGYESYTSTPRASMSQSRPMPPRRTSTSNVQGHFSSSSTASKSRTRPSTRRSMKPYNHHQPQQVVANSHASLYVVRSPAAQQSPPASTATAMESVSSYFQFPSPDPLDIQHPDAAGSSRQLQHAATDPVHDEQQELHPLPPQTTHYWTSDRTRRLEYAAIDAASRGVKGWIRRNLLPDCFVSQHDQHVAFDDDTGSVRRYRLELEDDILPSPAVSAADGEKMSLPRRRKPWQVWK